MLIETPYKVGDTVSFKLTSGEEIVGRLDAEEPGVYTLKRPMTMVAQQSGLGLAPFMFSVSPDGKFMLQSNAVSCIAKTEKEISNQYTAQTSGITMVN